MSERLVIKTRTFVKFEWSIIVKTYNQMQNNKYAKVFKYYSLRYIESLIF